MEKALIRNFCIIAHIDHPGTKFRDYFKQESFYGSHEVACGLRFMKNVVNYLNWCGAGLKLF